MYEMKRTVNCSQIGSHGIIRNSCLVDFLQDCSVIHLDTHPVMSHFFEKENCVMFLVSRQLICPCFDGELFVLLRSADDIELS